MTFICRATVVLSRKAKVSDQLVLDEVLKVAYAKLDIADEFLDVENMRALAPFTSGLEFAVNA